jgi:glycosyltransferase involved in cell wall biosynthesis
VVALIPALNEESTIGEVVSGALRYVDRVVVVDDLSVDKTAAVARETGAVVVSLDRRRRVGGVIQAGLRYVRELDPDVVVILDGDGQHSPDDIPRLLGALGDGVDWVIGSRFLYNHLNHRRGVRAWYFRQRRHVYLKGLGNWFFSKLVSVLTGRYITDVMSGFKALSREALDALDLRFDYAYCPEMAMALCFKGYRLLEVPVEARGRVRGSSRVVVNIVPYGLKQLGIIFFTYLRKN